MTYRLSILNVNESYVYVDCESDISYELREHFTFNVPGYQFMPSYRNKIWDGKIRLFDIRSNRIYRGLVPEIVKFCEARNYTWEYENEVYDEEFSLAEAKEFIAKLGSKHEPRDYQIDAFVHAIRARRALLLSPTGSGKSFIMYLVMRYLLETGLKGLIVVPTIQLVEQLYSDFEDYSETNGWKVEEHCHRIYQGKAKDSEKLVTISTWQSIYKLGFDWFKKFDFVLGDECHQFQSKSLVTIMTNLVNAKYRIGTTGTLDGTKTHQLVLEGLFGAVRKVTTSAELIDQGFLSEFQVKGIILKHSEEKAKAATKFDFRQEVEYIIGSESRNRFLTNLALSLNTNTLILFQFVEKHGKVLHEILLNKANGRKVFYIHGKIDVEIREEIRKIVETEKDAIILASFGTFSTGINIKNLHNVIFATAYKTPIKTLQSIGRTLRPLDNKMATLYDIADDLRYKKKENHTIRHFAERLKIYGAEKFPFKLYKVELK